MDPTKPPPPFYFVFGDEKALVTKEARVLMKEKTLLISN
jgi:hypothetical protein